MDDPFIGLWLDGSQAPLPGLPPATKKRPTSNKAGRISKRPASNRAGNVSDEPKGDENEEEEEAEADEQESSEEGDQEAAQEQEDIKVGCTCKLEGLTMRDLNGLVVEVCSRIEDGKWQVQPWENLAKRYKVVAEKLILLNVEEHITNLKHTVTSSDGQQVRFQGQRQSKRHTINNKTIYLYIYTYI